ncbi:uncharacterized protein tasor2 isoform X1 [Salarias fasciatus]|uniref:Protein TASOR-like n=1 Tax=Salarias fasciatus TaxID=181472 RepID=A0A672I6W3_SALFA|nr:uncharacterized protein LOC115391659 isoform X1 [Salarias fasciatus]
MERENGGVSSEGFLIPVPESSQLFETVLAPLQSAYLYEESKQFFKYKSAVRVKNPALEAKYNAFREKRKQAGYSEDDLKESYGFLLFDDANKAYALGKTGVLTGNSTCTTLGDPSKGVYISMFSDCLDSNCWYHGKSGYIAIIRLTKGKVKKVVEIYTQNLTTPTEGFDCHVSEQLPTVSSETSSFLAFERTQYYMYERLNDGSNETAPSPSAACPFAIVEFSYTDTKATLPVPQEKSEVKRIARPYLPWRGKLQIGSQSYSVGLRSTAGASMPSKLPPVVKIDKAISMVDLRHLLPKTVFETCLTGEAFLDGLYCSLCELISTEVEENRSLALLVAELKKKDAALAFPLNDGGFLILLHSSHFLGCDDMGTGSTEGLQGIFVFPDSRVAVRDVKFGLRPSAISLEKLWFLPSLRSAKGKVGKPAINSSEQLWERLVHYMCSYEALLKSRLGSWPCKEFSVLPAEYNDQNTHKHVSSSPEWIHHAWQGFNLYLSKPECFQVPLSSASDVLAAEQEEQREDLDDDVYICPSPELVDPVSNPVQDQVSDKTCTETSLDSFSSRAEARTDLPIPRQCAMHTEMGKSIDTEGKKQLISLSEDLPSELIVSITSAEQSVGVESISVGRNMSTTKHNDFKFGGISMTSKLQSVQTNSHTDETDEARKVVAYPQVTKLTKPKKRRGQRGFSKKQTLASTACVRTPSSQTEKAPDEIGSLKSQKDRTTKQMSANPRRRISSNTAWRRAIQRKHTTGAQEKTSDAEQQNMENSTLMELKAGPLRKKTEVWDLKPVVSECGRILVPHGSVDVAYHIKHIQEKIQATKDELGLDKPLLDTSTKAHNTVEMEKKACADQETSVDEMGITTSMECRNQQQNMKSHVDPEESVLEHSDNCTVSKPLNTETNVEWLNKVADHPPLREIEEKKIGFISTPMSPLKGEILLTKLKSVLSRGKRKLDFLMMEEATANTVEDIQPCHKQQKVESETEMLTRNSASTLVESIRVNDMSSMLPVDVFANALGLTPKESPVQRTQDQDYLQKEDSPETRDKQILRRPLMSSPRRRRIKTLKKFKGITEECIKKTWWLHFQTPACNSSENLTYKDCSRDNLFRKTVKENVNSVCTSTDGLNLLADLALGASSGQVPLPPHPALESPPETSLKKCELTKSLTAVDQDSILHALLRQPPARAVHLPDTTASVNHLVGGDELVGLLMKEHAYSLDPSSSLLLGLPGTPFQASPVSGSTRLLLHHQAVYGDKYKTLHSSLGQEDQYEATNSPDCLKKLLTTRQKFRHSRTFVYKDGSLQVTRQWQEKYNFAADSKFTNETKNKAIIRALHGPWDFSIQDTDPEKQLIIHMWIGLFYSRSTARFFHADSNLEYSSSEDPLDIPSAVISDPAGDDLADISDPSTPEALDLSKRSNSASSKESVVLDLSLKNSIAEAVPSDEQVSKMETSESDGQEKIIQALNELKSPRAINESQQEPGQSTEHNSDVTDVNDMAVDEERDDKSFGKTMIPFIGPDTSGDDISEPLHSLQPSDVEEIPFTSETTNSEAVLPTAVLATSEICARKTEPSSPKLPLQDVSETDQPQGNHPENRCPTPTIDEKPYESRPFGFKNADEILKNISEMSSSSSNDDLPEKKKNIATSAVNTHLHVDLEARILRVLPSVSNLPSKSNLTDKPSQIKLTDMNESSDPTPDSTSSHTYLREEEKPTMACATQDLPAESLDPNSYFKERMEQILCVKLQVEKANLSVPQLSSTTNDEVETSGMTDDCNSHTSVPSTECLPVNESHENQEIDQTTSECSSKQEPCRPEEPHMEKSLQNILTSTPIVKYTKPTPALTENTKKDHFIGNSKKLDESHMVNGPSSADTRLTNGRHYKSKSVKTELALRDPAFSDQQDDNLNVNRITSSSLSLSSFDSAKSSPNQFDEDQSYFSWSHSVENLEQRIKETSIVKQGESPDASAPIVTCEDNGMGDESLVLSPKASLVCTILNTNQTTSVSFLEQISKRCLQDDPTQASVEQACLIFSEKMKQLLKKTKRGPTQQEEAHNSLSSSCTSPPMMIHFSNLEEQDISLYPLGNSLFGQTIMVDMSDRKDQQRQNSGHPREKSRTASNPLDHAGVSKVTAECARLYKATMHDICAVELDFSRPKYFNMDGVHSKTEPSNHFDFCDQMKREMDETFRSKLNSIVKKSCKTRYRFFILMTSDDTFFDETKAQLQAEGHTAVDPDEFFIKDSLSSLLIILRNEDIAEHIFQVPHLLELKRTPNVLFAGIDEPDDVLNLTYQEVFTAGGIVMIDKAALESLSLCNMKKISTILQELNGMGKWKWMLHYRDSRRIKENARLSAEAKEKKNFLLWGQDAGMLEVMPYHGCDLMSRDHPDYLTCLVRLQIQNISSRHTVFITDNATDGAYERKGIYMTTVNSFLTKPPSETFTV